MGENKYRFGCENLSKNNHVEVKKGKGWRPKIVGSTGGLGGSAIEHRTQLPDVNMQLSLAHKIYTFRTTLRKVRK